MNARKQTKLANRQRTAERGRDKLIVEREEGSADGETTTIRHHAIFVKSPLGSSFDRTGKT